MNKKKKSKSSIKVELLVNQIICGHNIRIMRKFPDNSIDSIVTDPPYGLGFMGKEWDTFNPDFVKKGVESNLGKGNKSARGRNDTSPAWVAARYDHSRNAEFQKWFTKWAKECLRVAKPGAFMLVFGGTRTFHRLTCAIEDAGWQIRDCLMWLYGSGFPKSLDISKAVDKSKGKKRKIVGSKKGVRGADGTGHENDVPGMQVGVKQIGIPITLPASDLAKLWDGYGTALKPSFEPILLCQKPLTTVLSSDIIYETQNLLGALLCQSLLNVDNVKRFLKYNPRELKEVSASALMLVNLLHISELKKLSEKMGMFKSQEMGLMCLNTAKLWSNILNVAFTKGSMFTTETVTNLTIGLKILNCLLYKNIPVEVIQVVSHLVGLKSNVLGAEKALKETKNGAKNIRRVFAPVLAILSQSQNGTNVKSVKRSLQPIIQNVNSALSVVLQSIITEKEMQFAPNWEPIIVAMKPVDGNFAKNAEKYGVAGLNIAGGRIGTSKNVPASPKKVQPSSHTVSLPGGKYTDSGFNPDIGRWPANVILDEEAAKILDKQSGISISKISNISNKGSIWGSQDPSRHIRGHNDSGGASRFFYIAKASRGERNAGLGGMPDIEYKMHRPPTGGSRKDIDPETRLTNKNIHPTVKPLQLMQYLCMLLKMPNKDQIILDPFVGSGTTCVACKELGINYIGIDNNEDYCELARKRLKNVKPRLFEKPKRKSMKKRLSENLGLLDKVFIEKDLR